MTRWWPSLETPSRGTTYAFKNMPWEVWFEAYRPPSVAEVNNNDDGYNLDPYHYPESTPQRVKLWWYKISPSNGHKEQLAFRTDVTVYIEDYEFWERFQCKSGMTYILTMPDDTPNWGDTHAVEIGAPCSNWNSDLYSSSSTIRSQTSAMQTAIACERLKSVGLKTAIAFAGSIRCELSAFVRDWVTIQCQPKAAIEGDTFIRRPLNAAISNVRSTSTALVSAAKRETGTTFPLRALVQKTWRVYNHVRAAVQGETGIQCGLRALIVLSRRDAIRLEFEPRLPQDWAQVSVPNWSSEPFDSRVERVGE